MRTIDQKNSEKREAFIAGLDEIEAIAYRVIVEIMTETMTDSAHKEARKVILGYRREQKEWQSRQGKPAGKISKVMERIKDEGIVEGKSCGKKARAIS